MVVSILLLAELEDNHKMANRMIRRSYFQGQVHRRETSHRGYWSGWLIMSLLTLLTVIWLGYRWLIHPSWINNLPIAFTDTFNPVELVAAISLVFLWTGLLWRRYQNNNNQADQSAISKDMLLELDLQDFELFVADLFQKGGYRVINRGGSGDYGVDLELFSSDGRRAIGQCKRYRDTAGEKTVRDLFGTLLHEGASRAFLVTTADISEPAIRWTQGKPITLINGDQLVDIATAMKN